MTKLATKTASEKRRKTVKNNTQLRLIDAILALWSQHSQAEISVRMVAGEADASVSAIDYHFGNLEHLFCAAQTVALDRASDWLCNILAEFDRFSPDAFTPEARAAVFASLIERWVGENRLLALAWREAHAAAIINPNLAGPHRQWSCLWSDFWRKCCVATGLSETPELIAFLFDGEASQHLIRWRPMLDRALLDETALAFFRFMESPVPPSCAVRHCYHRLADQEYSLALGSDEAFTPIDDAAAALLSENGLASLTFRSVASRAGVTLGTVAYHFGSKSRMLRRALQRIYEGSSRQPTLALIEALPSSGKAIAQTVAAATLGGKEPVLRALDEITLNLCRGGSDKALAGMIRGFRDPVGSAVLGKLIGKPELATASLVAAFSSVIRGFGHWSTAADDRDALDQGVSALEAFCSG